LTVLDCTIGGERLEGIGVSPDIEVEDHCSQAGKDEQMRKATEKLIQIIESKK
jgi:C-terminal processing protease CtpA/Prc